MEIIRRVFNDKKSSCNGFEGLFKLYKSENTYCWLYIAATCSVDPDLYLKHCNFEDLYVSIDQLMIIRIPFKEEHLQ